MESVYNVAKTTLWQSNESSLPCIEYPARFYQESRVTKLKIIVFFYFISEFILSYETEENFTSNSADKMYWAPVPLWAHGQHMQMFPTKN